MSYRAARQRPIGPDDFRRPTSKQQGLTRAEVAMALRAQGGACAVCGTTDFGRMGPVVDHSHARARSHGHHEGRGCPRCFRGVTCDPCNRGLGAFRDRPDVLRAAAEYLERRGG